MKAGAVIFLLVALVLSYFIWPTGITDSALAAIKFGEVLRVIGSIFTALFGLAWCVMLLDE